MRALMLKDIYVLLRQLKLFVIVMVIFALAFQENAVSFIIFYAAMLTVSSMAYDEQSKWPQLAMMLPYSIRDIVLSKYLLGWLMIGGMTLLSMLQIFIDIEYVWVSLVVACVAMSFMSVILPLVFWLGTEKGRMLMIAMMAAVFGVVSAIGYISIVYGLNLPTDNYIVLLIACLFGVVLLNAGSVMLSIKLYKRRLLHD